MTAVILGYSIGVSIIAIIYTVRLNKINTAYKERIEDLKTESTKRLAHLNEVTHTLKYTRKELESERKAHTVTTFELETNIKAVAMATKSIERFNAEGIKRNDRLFHLEFIVAKSSECQRLVAFFNKHPEMADVFKTIIQQNHQKQQAHATNV